MTERFFPFRSVPKGSTVVLYGAGIIGRRYIMQNEELSWCHIKCALDKNYKRIKNFPIEIFDPKQIQTLSYDYVIISLGFFSLDENNEIEKIRELLIGYGVDRDRIIYEPSLYLWKPNDIKIKSSVQQGCELIRIAFVVVGTLGNLVISLRLYQALESIVERGIIDVFNPRLEVAKAVFWGQKKLGSVSESYEKAEVDYDLVIWAEYEPEIREANLERLKQLSPQLFEKVKRVLEYQKKDSTSLPISAYSNRIKVDRAHFLGLNRYTLLSANRIFNLSEENTPIYLNDSFYNQFKNLNLGNCYITFSQGAGKKDGVNNEQTKSWPRHHCITLLKFLKERFPQIKIVQLGGDNSKCIENTDACVFGYDLEIVKYIIKNSLLHFDCESGLVHLATQLGTKCFVLFGPTPKWFFGYESNENIVAKTCCECYDLIPDWDWRCMNYDEPICMNSISPQIVFKAIESYLISELKMNN